ncbi:MAG: hypothetical protein LW884_03140 [Bacteroidetes bacterium]|jgi:hypothetical protein|nr:hypothetical protein [Bacteroidota bacterium]
MKKPNIRFYRNKRSHKLVVLNRKFNPPARGLETTLQEANRPLIEKFEAALAAKKQ